MEVLILWHTEQIPQVEMVEVYYRLNNKDRNQNKTCLQAKMHIVQQSNLKYQVQV